MQVLYGVWGPWGALEEHTSDIARVSCLEDRDGRLRSDFGELDGRLQTSYMPTNKVPTDTERRVYRRSASTCWTNATPTSTVHGQYQISYASQSSDL